MKNTSIKVNSLTKARNLFGKKSAAAIFGVALAVASFSAGVGFNASQTAGSAIPLPIAKGGTGATAPAAASANLLGVNFANYNTPLTTSNLSYNSTYTVNGTSSVSKYGKVVTVVGSFQVNKNFEGGCSIGAVPAGFRPGAPQYAILVNTTSPWSNSGAVYVASNGNISFQFWAYLNGSGASTPQYATWQTFSITYVIP